MAFTHLMFARITTKPIPSFIYLCFFFLMYLAPTGYSCPTKDAKSIQAIISQAVAGPHRTEAFRNRDNYRNPKETLEFFGLTPNMTVIEIWPGSKGWYTEILAPILRKDGKLIAAHFPKSSPLLFFRNSHIEFLKKIKTAPAVYDRMTISEFNPPKYQLPAPQGSADMVLTFRNVHNWVKAGKEDQFFEAFNLVLKPGGILGIVEHRGAPGMSKKRMSMSGYVPEEYVTELAKKHGFKLVAKSEINANPKDTKMYPEGVWTLPPTLRLKEQNRTHYLSIGESDRMTLKFIKKRL